MERYKVVTASEVTVEEYKNLRLAALQDSPQAFAAPYERERGKTDDEWRRRLERFQGQDPLEKIIFARDTEKQDQLVAMLGVHRDDNNRQHIVELFETFVAPDARGNGLGKTLLESMVEHLQSNGVEEIMLWVNTEQESAVRMYQHAGFAIQETIQFRLGDGEIHDEYIMGKKL